MNTGIVSDDFWEFLEDEACDDDTGYLPKWLARCMVKYENATPCPNCGSRQQYTKNTYDATGNYCLFRRVSCSKCRTVIGETDEREATKALLLAGEIKLKHVESLRKELGLE